MNAMKDRIKELRKHLKLNQTEFGQRIGVKQGTIAGYENGLRIPLDTVIASICREFDVNEKWLRNGEGPMFVELTPDEEFDKICLEIQISDDEIIKKIMRAYWQLDKEDRQAVQRLIDNISS